MEISDDFKFGEQILERPDIETAYTVGEGEEQREIVRVSTVPPEEIRYSKEPLKAAR